MSKVIKTQIQNSSLKTLGRVQSPVIWFDWVWLGDKQCHIETLRTGPNERFGRWSIDALHGTGKCIQEPGKCIQELEVGISNFHTSQQLSDSLFKVQRRTEQKTK